MAAEFPSAVTRAIRAGMAHHIARLQRYIRQPSVSALAQGNTEMAAVLAEDIQKLGGQADVVPGVDFPIVYGRIEVGASRTVLVHSMYDTTPADEPEWIVPPFEGRRLEFEDFGECIVGRGAEDTKGPLSAVLAMLDSYRQSNTVLPVNLILLFEASELGSASLPVFVRNHLDELKRADAAYWPWHTQRSDGTAVAWLGCKGLITLRLRVRSGAWGGPLKSEIHGQHSSWISNPIHELAAALATLKSRDDLEIAVDGFSGESPGPSPADEELVQALADRLEPALLLSEIGAARFKHSRFRDSLRAHLLEPELNVSGIQGGHASEDSHKVVIPTQAGANVEIRPVPGMSVDQIMASLRKHFDKHGFAYVEIVPRSGYVGGRVPPSNWAARELTATYREMGFDPEVWPCTATAIAVDLFTETLGIPWVGSCLGHAGRKHSANEYLQLSTYPGAIEFIARLLWRMGKASD
jgi:acetylornithine deacetylase/succinyl-diaminopimelate desuccinylase-like protein